MSDILKHKGYIGSVEHDIKNEILHGKIQFINDLVTYEAVTIPELKKEFILAVDDYLATCKELGRDPQKSFKGSFNVRVGEDIHRDVALSAYSQGVSINQFVTDTLAEKCHQ